MTFNKLARSKTLFINVSMDMLSNILKVVGIIVAIYIVIGVVAYMKQGTIWCGALPDNLLGNNYRAACWNGSLFR